MSADQIPSSNQPPQVNDETWSFLRDHWAEMRAELDRSLFLASSAGIGFSTAMLFDKDLMANACLMWSLFVALIAFSLSAASILLVFKFNADYLHRLMNDPQASNKDNWLGTLDWLGVSTFIMAVIAVFVAICIRLFS